MLCPKCQSEFEKVASADGVADRCTHCEGLWFDNMEHEDLKPHAAFIDTGAAAKGAGYNTIDHIHCPVCPNSPMLRMVDPVQPHIWFEGCPTCYGRFYDAGEFRDFSEVTIADVFKRRLVKARS